MSFQHPRIFGMDDEIFEYGQLLRHHTQFTPRPRARNLVLNIASTADDKRRQVLDAIGRAKTLKLCLRRIWAVASSLPDRENSLPELIPVPGAFSIPGHDRERHEHEQCTFDFCEQSRVDFTSVAQHHEAPCPGKCEQITFPLQLLDERVTNRKPTAWRVDEPSLLDASRPYMAISHVWSDGTGTGIWGPGKVNKCLYTFFSKIARDFQCDGCWWDSISIPVEDKARNKALSSMHSNYNNSRITLVHDLYLREWEWVDPETACFAIVMSPWYSRGWTALELAQSHKVKILFKAKNNNYVIKDLDVDILAEVPESHATADAIRKLRRASIDKFGTLLAILGARDTSKPRDVPVISGLLAGVDVSGGLSQQEIYQRILRKLGKVAQGHLFHNSATMSAPGFNWCPTNILDMPMAEADSALLKLHENGDLEGDWRVKTIESIKVEHLITRGTHPLTQVSLESAFCGDNTAKHILLLEKNEPKVASHDRRALLVRLKEKENSDEIFAKFVGPVYFRESSGIAEQECMKSQQIKVRIGSTEGLNDIPEKAWDYVQNKINDKASKTEETPTTGRDQPDTKSDAPPSHDDTSHRNSRDWRAVLFTDGAPGKSFLENESRILSTSKNPQVKAQDDMTMFFCRGSGLKQAPRAFFYGNEGMVHKVKTWLGQNSESSKGHVIVLAPGNDNMVKTGPKLNAKHAEELLAAALFLAAEHNHKDDTNIAPLVTLLLDIKGPYHDDDTGRTPLHTALEEHNYGVAQTLLNYKSSSALVDAKIEKTKETALHIAAKDPNIFPVISDLLVEQSDNVDVQDQQHSRTALHHAAESGNTVMAEKLLTKSASLSIRDSKSQVALHCAASKGLDVIVRLLLKYAGILPSGSDGKEIMDTCNVPIEHTDKSTITDINRATGQDSMKEAGDGNDGTVDENMMGADCISNKDDTPPKLHKHGEPSFLDIKDHHGQTPLHLAAEAGHLDVVATLLTCGANACAKTGNGETALILAAQAGHQPVVAALLASGANACAKTGNGETALILAAKHGHTETVKTLLELRKGSFEQAELNSALLMAAVGDYDVVNYEGVIDALYKNGGRSPGSCVFKGMTALHWTIRTDNGGSAKTLIQSQEKADIDVLDGSMKQSALLMASEKGMTSVVTELLKKGADINLADLHKRTALHLAAIGSYHDTIIELLLREESSKVLNERDNKNRTALHWAAVRGSQDVTKEILTNKHSLCQHDIVDEDRRTALDIASEQGLDAMVGIFLRGSNSPSPTLRDHALRLAAKAGKLSVAMLLYKSIDDKDEDLKASTLRTILLAAAANPGDNTTDELWRDRINPNIQDEKGRSLLMLAIKNRHERLPAHLFGSFLKTDLQDSEGKTALMVAAIEDNSDMIRHLFYYDADLNVVDNKGYTALHYAVEGGCYASFVTLLRYRAQLEIQDENGRNALHLAVTQNLELIADKLLGPRPSKSYQYLDTTDVEGQTPLLMAAAKGYTSLVRLLLSHSFKPDTQDKDGRTPLLLTAEIGDDYLVRSLLSHDANPNLQDKRGRTALSQAAQNGHVNVVAKLLNNHKIDLNSRDSMDRTALILATGNGHENIVDSLLRDHGHNHKIDLNARDSMGRTALILATGNGHENIVDSLLRDRGNNHKIDLNARDSMGRTALILATGNGHENIVDSLLRDRGDNHKTNLNIRDNMGRTALILAAENGHDNIVETLVRSEANADVVGNDGKKAWQKAVDKGHASVVKTLLSIAPIQDRQAVNEALLLASRRGWANLVKVLLEQEVDLTFQSSGDKWTALHMAAMSGHQEVLSMLIKNGVDIVIKDRDGRTALLQATEQGFKSIVGMLLRREEIKNDIDAWMGKESLLFAAEKGYDGIVELLLDSGIDYNATGASDKTAMALAAGNGKESIVKMLLGRGASWAIKDNDGRTALHHAAWAGHHNIVETLLACEPPVPDVAQGSHTLDSNVVGAALTAVDLSVVDNGGQSALHLAAERASLMAVDRLLDKRPNVNAKCKDGQTALHRAAWGGSHEVVKLLRKSGADPFIRDNQDKRPWHIAAEKGHETISKELLEEEDNVYDERIKDEKALIFAAKKGYTIIARCLLQKHAEATVKDQDGRTPLHWAAARNDKELAKLLIDHRDVSINAVDHEGRTALCLAVLLGSTAAVEILLKSRLNADLPDGQGQTALHHAAQRGNEEITQMLIDHNSDPHIHDKKRRKAWQLAAEKGHHQVVRLLLKKEIDLSTHNQRREELFLKMSEQGLVPMVQLLLDLGVDKNVKDRFGRTAIGLAAERGFDDVLRLLLFKGANLNIADRREQTPLLWAAKAGNEKIISLLLDKITSQFESNQEGDSVNRQDAEGRTALVVAIENKRDKAVKLLLDKCKRFIEVDIKDKMQRTALQLAAEMGNNNWVQLLLRNNAGQQHRDSLGRTALLLAAEQGHTEVVKTLLNDSKDHIDVADDQGRTPLQAATDCGDRDMVVALLGADADPLQSDGRSRTALLLAVEHGDKFIVDLLLQRNAAQDADEDGRTPLLLAVANGDKAIVEALLNYSDADPNVKSDKAIVETLLDDSDAGPDTEPNTKITPSKKSLLHLAVDSGNKDVAWLVLKMVTSRDGTKQEQE